jgi:hypothetical protein
MMSYLKKVLGELASDASFIGERSVQKNDIRYAGDLGFLLHKISEGAVLDGLPRVQVMINLVHQGLEVLDGETPLDDIAGRKKNAQALVDCATQLLRCYDDPAG